MYDGNKKTLGPVPSKTAPLKSSTRELFTVRDQQMERCLEHYSNLYSTQNIVSPSALDAIDCLPTMDELGAEPTVEDLSKVIDSLASGSDGIPLT